MIVREVCGKRADVYSLVEAGKDPHLAQLTPSMVEEFSKAVLFVSTGHLTVEDKFVESVARPAGMEVVSLQDYLAEGAKLSKLPGVSGENLHGYWLEPDNAIAIAWAVAHRMSTIDPENQSYYLGRAKLFEERVGELKELLAATSAELDLEGAGAVVCLPAEAYWAEALGMNVVEVLKSEEHVTPSPEKISRIASLAKEGKIRYVIASDMAYSLMGEYIEQISSTTGLRVIRISVFCSSTKYYTDYLAYNAGLVRASAKTSSLSETTLSAPAAFSIAVLSALVVIEAWALLRRRE